VQSLSYDQAPEAHGMRSRYRLSIGVAEVVQQLSVSGR
jgi:hypothetical protein